MSPSSLEVKLTADAAPFVKASLIPFPASSWLNPPPIAILAALDFN